MARSSIVNAGRSKVLEAAMRRTSLETTFNTRARRRSTAMLSASHNASIAELDLSHMSSFNASLSVSTFGRDVQGVQASTPKADPLAKLTSASTYSSSPMVSTKLPPLSESPLPPQESNAKITPTPSPAHTPRYSVDSTSKLAVSEPTIPTPSPSISANVSKPVSTSSLASANQSPLAPATLLP